MEVRSVFWPVMAPTRIALAGSTGSIGTQTLDVVRSRPDDFVIVALAASGRRLNDLVDQIVEFRPQTAVIKDSGRFDELTERLAAEGVSCDVRVGAQALAGLADDADTVVNAVVGFAGLEVTMATLLAGRRLALANKESLIAGGPVVQVARRTPGAELVPIDSEHCALHQCLRANDNGARVEKLVLTASGGPFRGQRKVDLENVTVSDALAHPTWSMGPKITVDSSTLMNKGLEVIEAHELFGSPAGEQGYDIGFDQIDVVVHPQSVIHSMVEFSDAAVIAQLSMPDMRLPIGYALAYPDRITEPFGRIDWSTLGRLDFEEPDLEAFPCLGLAYEAGRVGGTMPAWLNAANEEAVEAFLNERIRWNQIPEVLESTMARHDGGEPDGIDAIVEADRRARIDARAMIERMGDPG